MTALIPSETNDMFEDMFKEITRKLYGDDASHSLHTPTTSVPNSVSNERDNKEPIGFGFLYLLVCITDI